MINSLEHVQHPELLEHTIQEMNQDAKEIVIDQNFFEFDNTSLRFLREEMDQLEVSANHCALKLNNASMTQVEELFLDKSHPSYENLIFELMRNQAFQERRFAAEETYSRHLLEEFIEWNAWYEPGMNFIVSSRKHLLLGYTARNIDGTLQINGAWIISI